MDEKQKARIRRSATWIHWVAQSLLVLALVFATYMRWGQKILGDSFSDQQMSSASAVLMNEWSRMYFGQGRELIAFLPPANPADQTAWAVRIEEHLGQPAAVFLKDGSKIQWVRKPQGFSIGIEHLENEILHPDSNAKKNGSLDTLGAMQIWRKSWDDSSGFKAWMVGPLADSLRWGVVIRFQDFWPAFCNQLKFDGNKPPRKESPAFILQDVVQLKKVAHNDLLPAVRILNNDRILFASPGLDTTRRLMKIDTKPFRTEYYESGIDASYAKLIGKSFVTWRSFLMPVLLVIVFYLNYRWIRKLTTPA